MMVRNARVAARCRERIPMGDTDLANTEMGHILRDWNAREYLKYYYGQPSVSDDEAALFRFIARGLRDIGRNFETGIELGCGPVVHHAAQAVPWVDRLDMADVQESNLEEIRRWMRRDPGAFDWSVLLGAANGALDAEEGRGGSIAEREALLRARINLMFCDLREPLPLGKPAQYPLVTAYYCTENVIPTVPGWRETMSKVTSLVASAGWLFLAGVHGTDFCMINGKRVPVAHLTEDEIRRALVELGFDASTVHLQVTPGRNPEASGIQGNFMAYAQRAT
jgi:nicotinamide N-methyltransferase